MATKLTKAQRDKARQVELDTPFYYPRIFRFETGLPDPKYFDDPNVNSHAEGYPDLKSIKLEEKHQPDKDEVVLVDPFGNAPTPGYGRVATKEEALFLAPDRHPDDEHRYTPPTPPGNDGNIFL